MHAVDLDDARNAEIRYSITNDDQCRGCFNIDPQSGIISVGSSSIDDRVSTQGLPNKYPGHTQQVPKAT